MRWFFSYSASMVVHSGTMVAFLVWSLLPISQTGMQVQISKGKPVALVMVLPTAASQPMESPPITIEVPPEPVDPSEIEPREMEVTRPTHPIQAEPPPVIVEVSTDLVPPQSESTDRMQASEEPPAPQPLAEQLPRTDTKPPPPESVASVALAFQAESELGLDVDVLPTKLAHNRPPLYPVEALNARIEGRVILRVKISAEGTVLSSRLETSSGHASLDDSAVRAVAGWRFTPAQRAGRAVAYEVLVPVNFLIVK